MAEPLTSSDLLRERMGFGVSPLASPETRRAYAAAGLSPLGTQERERFERGGALSPMASTAEKEAWKMAEFQAGRREQAPISYGGIGDRPVGSSRRAIRMQEEWDKQRAKKLEEQRIAQQMEMERRQNVRAELDSTIKAYGFEKEQEQDILNKRITAQNEAAEANFFKFANTLDPNDPTAASKMADYISANPSLAQSESAQKSFYYFQQASENSAQALANQQQKEINTKLSEARQLGISNKELSTVQDIDPNTGEVFTDINKLQELIDTTKGQRTLKEEERKEGRGEYRPMSVEQAQDELSVARAEFNSISKNFDEEDEQYQRSEARLRKAEAQLEVSQGRAKPEPAKERGYEVGKSYGGMIYTGGDPNLESSWKKK